LGNQSGDKGGWLIKNGVKALDLSSWPRCRAVAKTTGKKCKRPALKGLHVCGIHAGRYTPGAKADNQNALTHGLFTAKAKQQRALANDNVTLLARLNGHLNAQVKSTGVDSTCFYNTTAKEGV